MKAAWQFYRQQPTDPIHNPISGEFFSTEAVGDVTEALIREGIQNTLDARKTRGDGSRESAKIRIFLSDRAGALPASRARRWFADLWPHVTAPGNGLRDQPSAGDACPFLVFEDFNTIGLLGDPDEHLVVGGVTNHFLNFFRAEGHSDKGEQDRGSWGVGKTVFPRASRISSFIGFTVRSNDARQLLLGRSILKYHRVNGYAYKSDGYFGVKRPDGFMLPTDDQRTIEEFRRDFSIHRKNESGLSIVVPWYDTAGEDEITSDKVMGAVLRGFFYPILMGHLSVSIATQTAEVGLDANSIAQQVDRLGGAIAQELLPLISLTEWAQTRTSDEFSLLLPPPADTSQAWSVGLVPQDVIQLIRGALAQHQRIALRVPMSVQPRDNGPQPTFFKVFLEHSDKETEKPVFIRDELIIPDVRSPRVPQVRALVIVEGGPLATLLRDAETPAHTQWNHETSKFKNKYKFGAGAIKFVRLSVSELFRVINQAEQRPDPTITIDFFSLPAAPDDEQALLTPRRRPRPVSGAGPVPPTPPLPPPRQRRFRIDKLKGGFSIRSGDPGAPIPPFIDIRVAYDVRRGNPLKRYNSEDFDLDRAPIVWNKQFSGGLVASASSNRLLLALQSLPFQFDVTGFDPDRDLYVKAEVQESADVD